MKKAILFDLDGTLLPMELQRFIKAYFGLLMKKMAGHGYDPEQFKTAMWAGVNAEIANDGTMKNEERFWSVLNLHMERDCREEADVFAEFYQNEFHQAKAVCGFQPLAKEAVALARQGGRWVILATSPLYPKMAVAGRVQWAGLDMDDFDLATTYDTERFCKPNPLYYQDILDRLGLKPQECLMIGNDEKEDMWAAAQAGIEGYLVTDDLIPYPDHPHQGPRGSFEEMVRWLREELCIIS